MTLDLTEEEAVSAKTKIPAEAGLGSRHHAERRLSPPLQHDVYWKRVAVPVAQTVLIN
jgi:hypothetical protein